MSQVADLHIHTFYSDSTSSPEDVVKRSLEAGLSAIAITDHDTLEGIQPTLEAAKGKSLEVITGIELSSEIHGKEVHILGYLFDGTNKMMLEQLHSFQKTRVERMKKMIVKLDELGIKGINLEEVCALTQSQAVGRPHLASILVKKGKVLNTKEAFDKYLAEGAPAYVPKQEQSPFEVIALINEAGGLAVLAHPMLTGLDELIPSFVKAGLGGLEVYYPNCTQTVVQYYENIAKKHNICLTGGSDDHGKAKNYTAIGRVKIPYELIEKMKEYLKKG